MKLAILGLLLIFGTANSVPTDISNVLEGTEEPPANAEILPESIHQPSVDTKEILDEIMEDMEDNTTIDMDGEPSAHYLEEVKEYFQQQKSHNRVARQSSGALYHGSTIALQTYVRNLWLGCANIPCGRYPCPRMYMTEWTTCGGEVFGLYRAAGPGAVRVGDLVGLYQGHWFSCAGNECGKSSCPGHPTTAYGFETHERWFTCWGEVFIIYAKGKSNGAIINSMDDDIALYYLQQGGWVSQGDGHTVKRPCLGTARPPSSSIYDGCALEIFKVWKN